MKTSIIILTYNKLKYTKRCIESIRTNTKKDCYEIIVVDNCSNDGTREWLKKQNDIITIFNNENLGFPKGCNQGMKLSKGDNVLLLNNDTVVTENWLNNLNACLYSSSEIAAVGPVTNSCAYYQEVNTNYNTLKEMRNFSKEYNVSDKSKWEERLKLIGFCILIKREVIEKTGFLDEIFSPGNYEDDDYSARIRKAGYKLMLCNDTFIHHYGGTSFKENKDFSQLLRKNEIKFKEKWGFTSAKNMEINRRLVELINKSAEDNFKVLQIGCGCGATLLNLKNKYRKARIYGVDINKKALNQAEFLDGCFSEDIYNIDKICNHFNDIKFQYIFINHILLENNENNRVLSKLKGHLVNQGKIFIELNVNDIKKTEVTTNRLMPEEIIKILTEEDYKNIDGLAIKDENKIIKYIFHAENIKYENKEKEKMMENVGQTTTHKKKDRLLKLKFLLRRIENNIEVEASRDEIYKLTKDLEINLEDIIFCIAKDIIKKDEVLNSVAVKFYEEGFYDNIIPLFQAAHEYNPKNSDVIYNLASFLLEFGEKKLALTYFEKIQGINSEVDEVITRLRGEV